MELSQKGGPVAPQTFEKIARLRICHFLPWHAALARMVAISLFCRALGLDAEALDETAFEEGCASLASSWVSQQRDFARLRSLAPKLNVTFHLHVPRTAGRQLTLCLMGPSFAAKGCMRQYNRDWVDWTCPCVATHADFRAIDGVSLQGQPAIMMNMRDPVQRVLSAYEFAIEVSARKLGTDIKPREELNINSTRNVWPWKYLVPYIDGELNRKDRLRRWRYRNGYQPSKGSSCERFSAPPEEECAEGEAGVCSAVGARGTAPSLEEQDCRAEALDRDRNAFANSMTPSLATVVASDIADDLLANSGAFQLLGITNFSVVVNTTEVQITDGDQASQLRFCANRLGPSSRAGDTLRKFALWRLEHEVDVLLVHERLEESNQVAAAYVRRELVRRGEVIDEMFGQGYQRCLSRQQTAMAKRHDRGMKNILWPDGTRLDYTKEARANVPAELVEDIRKRNWLDDVLHQRAVELFDQRAVKLREEGDLESVPVVVNREFRDAPRAHGAEKGGKKKKKPKAKGGKKKKSAKASAQAIARKKQEYYR